MEKNALRIAFAGLLALAGINTGCASEQSDIIFFSAPFLTGKTQHVRGKLLEKSITQAQPGKEGHKYFTINNRTFVISRGGDCGLYCVIEDLEAVSYSDKSKTIKDGYVLSGSKEEVEKLNRTITPENFLGLKFKYNNLPDYLVDFWKGSGIRIYNESLPISNRALMLRH